jgi:hypothetical protein
MDLGNRITQIEDEIKVLKNEVLAVLLDVKENLLTRESPFNPQAQKFDGPSITINQAPAQLVESPKPAAPVELKPQVQQQFAEPKNTVKSPSEDTNDNDTEESEEEEVEDLFENVSPPFKSKKNGNGNGHLEKVSSKMVALKRRDSEFDSQIVTEDIKRWVSAPAAITDDHGSVPGKGKLFNDRIEIATLVKLADWVVTSSQTLGCHNTQTILDTSEMMGHLPIDLKVALEKMIPHDGTGKIENPVPTKVYLKTLNDLATLLDKKDATDFIVLHMVSHGLVR